jgi:hypothetical protein
MTMMLHMMIFQKKNTLTKIERLSKKVIILEIESKQKPIDLLKKERQISYLSYYSYQFIDIFFLFFYLI